MALSLAADCPIHPLFLPKGCHSLTCAMGMPGPGGPPGLDGSPGEVEKVKIIEKLVGTKQMGSQGAPGDDGLDVQLQPEGDLPCVICPAGPPGQRSVLTFLNRQKWLNYMADIHFKRKALISLSFSSK